MSRLPNEVVTERLLLRRWEVDDAPALSAAVATSLDHLRPWMSWASAEPLAEDDRAELIRSWQVDWEADGDAIYGAFHEGAVVGGCGLHRRQGPGVLEIGYWIHVEHVRRGFATELTAGLTTAAFGVDGIERVEVHHDKANTWSGAVPRSLGFAVGPERQEEIVAPGEVGINCVWSVKRVDWLSRLVPGRSDR